MRFPGNREPAAGRRWSPSWLSGCRIIIIDAAGCSSLCQAHDLGGRAGTRDLASFVVVTVPGDAKVEQLDSSLGS